MKMIEDFCKKKGMNSKCYYKNLLDKLIIYLVFFDMWMELLEILQVV